jgi:5-(carboxyamino)imidazole ribonucleotide synthase
MKRLGILGGGQLGRMIALDARRFDLHVMTLDPDPDSPCGQVADEQCVAEYDDLAAVLAFAAQCDIVTFEFENIPQAVVAAIEAQGGRVAPSSAVLSVTQDRVLEKEFVRSCGLKTAPFAPITSENDIDSAIATVGLPGILKTRRGGYDGKGQWRVKDRAELLAAFHDAQAHGGKNAIGLILEGLVAFDREVSVIAARGWDGACVTFPIAENEHRAGILAHTTVPANISPELERIVQDVARKIGDGLQFVGTFAVETFVVNGDIYVNEIAPRVHNSGHYTMEATSISQFEAHLRAILGYPLTAPRLLSPAVMTNLLGAGCGDTLIGIDEVLSIPETTLHLYGKREAKAHRKMGHITTLAPTREEAQSRAALAAKALSWGSAVTLI